MQDVLDYLDANVARIQEELFEFLRIPSVSADTAFAPDCSRCADWVRSQLDAAGVPARIVTTGGHPIVVGELVTDSAKPTVLVYGHYDVQPPDPLDLWKSPPFEPTIREGRIYARGATDDKGQLFTHIKSVEAWTKVAGGLPVNVRFVIEGEEEVGSNHLDDFLHENRAALKSDVAVISDTSQYGDGIPAITYGLRGICAVEVTVTGPDHDLHSGIFGGAVANPANVLATICGQLIDEDGRIQIPGFYDAVMPLTDQERAEFAELPFSKQTFLETTGSPDTHGEVDFSTLERRWARPTCDINGFHSGYGGEGPKTIIPASATAKITCRLVPNQQPASIVDALETYLHKLCPSSVRLKFRTFHGCPAFVFDPDSPWMGAATKAVGDAFGQQPVFIREGGSIPVVNSLREILGLDTLLLGWGRNTDNLHSPNEHFHVADFRNGMRGSALLWQELANVS